MYDFIREFSAMPEARRDEMLAALRTIINTECTIGDVIDDCCSAIGCVDTWCVLACIDFLVESGECEYSGYVGGRSTQCKIVRPVAAAMVNG